MECEKQKNRNKKKGFTMMRSVVNRLVNLKKNLIK